jgi:hypothetical protein
MAILTIGYKGHGCRFHGTMVYTLLYDPLRFLCQSEEWHVCCYSTGQWHVCCYGTSAATALENGTSAATALENGTSATALENGTSAAMARLLLQHWTMARLLLQQTLNHEQLENALN